MALLYEKVVSVVSKNPEERNDIEIAHILPWFRKKSELFKSQKAEIVKDIVKNCQFMTCKRDHVVIKQGDKGDCFYIILSGTVAVLIQTNLGEDGIQYTEPEPEEDGRKPKELDRSKFGNFVGQIPAGKSFGELALINADCVRNASIIADEPTDLLIVNRELYSRSLKAFQEREFNEKKRFVEEYPLFRNWPPRYKKQLAMSLRKERILFDGVVVKQGCPVEGLHFLLSGQAKMTVDPVQHEIQYPELFPLPDIEELEKVEARESIRREMNMAPPKMEDRKPTFYRARSPTVERKKQHRNIEVCVMGAVEMFGELETSMGLYSYAETAMSTVETEVFVLDKRNCERLIEKRNPLTLDIMRESLHEKLKLRLKWVQENDVPLFRYFLYKLDERKRFEIEKERYRTNRRKEREENMEWRNDHSHRGHQFNPHGRGNIFFSLRAREKKQRRQLKPNNKATFGFPRQPHSIAYLARKLATSDEEKDEDEIVDDHTVSLNGEFEMDTPDGRSLRRSRLLCDNANEHSNRQARGDRSRSDKSAEEFMNPEISESSLANLEDRIEAWHSKIEEKSARTHLVKLHRYTAEDHQKPLPGKRIVLKPKSRTKPSLLTLHLESLEGNNRSPPPQSLLTESPGLTGDITLYQDTRDAVQERLSPPTGVRPKRPLSSRTDFNSSIIQIRRRPKSARQFTAEEYEQLKEELRRKQRAYKSMLTRTSSFCG